MKMMESFTDCFRPFSSYCRRKTHLLQPNLVSSLQLFCSAPLPRTLAAQRFGRLTTHEPLGRSAPAEAGGLCVYKAEQRRSTLPTRKDQGLASSVDSAISATQTADGISSPAPKLPNPKPPLLP